MLELVVRAGPFSQRTKWFCARPLLKDSVRLVSYAQSSSRRRFAGFVRQPFSTMVVDLALREEEILEQTSKSVQYKIRRARREGLACGFGSDYAAFARFEAEMMAATGKKPLSEALLASASSNCCIAWVRSSDGVLLAMHCYLLADDQSRARLWHSVSRYSLEKDSNTRNMIGRANRLLHFESMLHFKELGYRLYDFGGYAFDQEDAKKMNINKFKDGFGGQILNESHYQSYTLYLAIKLRQLMHLAR